MLSIVLSIYGGYQLYDRTDRLDLAESQKTEIATLKLKVRDLRRINSLVPVLEQILTDCQIDELEAGAEVIRQNKWEK